MKYYKAGHSGMTGHFEHVKGSGGAIYVMEQQYIQGDTEAIFAKRMIYVFESDTDTHWTTANAINVAEDENITGLTWQKFIIRFIKLMVTDPDDFFMHISAQDDFENADPDLDDIIATVVFDNGTEAVQIAAGGLYRFSKGVNNDLYIPYEDEDGTYEFHAALEDNEGGMVGGADTIKAKFWAEVVA